MLRNQKVLPLYIALAASLAVTNVATAADWDVTQTSTVAATTSLTQNGSASSNQAINAVVLDTANDSINAGHQTAVLSGNTVSLTQKGASISGSVQTINLASANNISGLTQEVSGVQSAAMSIESTAGTGNVQAFNYALAAGTIHNLTQTVSGQTLTMDSLKVGNVQAVNYAKAATYSGSFEQTTTLGTLDYRNVCFTGCSDIRVNSVKGNTTVLAQPVNQTATITTLTVRGGNIILNHVEQ
jgi:hypothetical protein